jgi:hypothetical protein
MRGAQAVEGAGWVDAKGLACSLAELRTNEGCAIIGEADQALVECGRGCGTEWWQAFTVSR